MFLSQKKRRKPCYLSQTAGLHRFLILFKDYNTAAFFTGSGFRVQRYEEKSGKSEKNREIQRNSEKFREKRKKSEKFRENRINSDKNRRKTEKIGELSVNLRAYQ